MLLSDVRTDCSKERRSSWFDLTSNDWRNANRCAGVPDASWPSHSFQASCHSLGGRKSRSDFAVCSPFRSHAIKSNKGGRNTPECDLPGDSPDTRLVKRMHRELFGVSFIASQAAKRLPSKDDP